MATARISIFSTNDDGIEMISQIEEFEVPADAAKRRRMLMTRIGKIVDASTATDGPSSMTIIFDDIA